jgi:hypothetical protein
VCSVCGQLVRIRPEVSDLNNFAVVVKLEEAQPGLARAIGIRELDPAGRVQPVTDNADDQQAPVTRKPSTLNRT